MKFIRTQIGRIRRGFSLKPLSVRGLCNEQRNGRPILQQALRLTLRLTIYSCLAGVLHKSAVPPPLPPLPSFQFGDNSSSTWPVRVGRQIAALRAQIPTVDRVVLVPDTATFVMALEHWSLGGRWPILIEDDRYTPLFLRRFQPAEIIRLPKVQKSLPKGRSLEKRLQEVAAAAWQAHDPSTVRETWQQLGWNPPGVVITDVEDGAWPGALALAADRGEPLVFLGGQFRSPNDILLPKEWQRLNTKVEQAVRSAGYPYASVGDTIDTLTLVRQCAARYKPNNVLEAPLAVTDGLARHSTGHRWAIAGWIYGSSVRSVYQAMSAIFLNPQTAWFYDSYPPTSPWQFYALAPASEQLSQVGFTTTLIQRPEATRQHWLELSLNPITADLIFVNSKGSKETFDVGQGSVQTKDIPLLQNPSAVYFIHSYSAETPDDPATIAGRWLDNGAYLYVGSVHEPYLNAFVPPQQVTLRVLWSIPFLIAAREQAAAPWKLTTIGDPLMTLTPAKPRLSPRTVPLEHSKNRQGDRQ